MKAIDSSSKTVGQAKSIADAGYGAVGVYLRPDRCSRAMITELHNAQLQVWSTYEKGYPTTSGYFSQTQGARDGGAAVTFAKQVLNQPAGSQIYATVDFDPDHNDPNGPTITGPISQYMRAFKAAVEPAGYLASVYGSGRTCRILIANGLAKSGWLCQSTSFGDRNIFTPNAAIIQLPRINNSWDGDDVPNPVAAGLW